MPAKKKKKKSWKEKLHDSKDLPKVVKLDGKAAEKWGKGKMVIPSPIEVDALMRKVRKGKLVTSAQLRDALAASHKVNTTCPITTGIFAWIAAHAAEEEAQAGKKRITPYWRTLKVKGELNPKYPGGILEIKRRLEDEGHKVIARGKRWFVEDFEKSTMRLS